MHAVGTAHAARAQLGPGVNASLLDLRERARAHMPMLAPPPGLAEAARATWHGRMLNEYGSARVFRGLADRLEAAGIDAETVAQCRSFSDEEHHHGVLCGAVVEALGGEARGELAPAPAFPAHDDCDAREAAARDLLSICCLSETIAVALIGAERLEIPEGALHDLLTRIYADEVGHARFGWSLLPTLLGDDAGLRARLAGYLRVAFGHLETHELSHLPEASWPEEGAALGLCDGSDARALFYDTVERVIVPALEQHGLAAADAWRDRRRPKSAMATCAGA